MEVFGVVGIVLGIPTVIGWVIRNYLAHKRVMRVLELKAEFNARMLDRLGSEPGVLDILRSDAQHRMFEAGLPQPGPQLPATQSRMLTSAQIGLVLVSLGLGLLFIRSAFPDRDAAHEALLVFGTIGVAVGIGALLSAAAAYLVGRLWQNGEAGERAA